jgi:integrase
MNTAVPSPTKHKKSKPKHPTWEHPKGSGIKIAEIPNKTAGVVYGVSYQIRIPAELTGVPNAREQLQRKTKDEAERLAEDRFVALKKHGTEFSKIPAAVQKQAAIAWSILDEHNGQTKLALNLIDVVKAGVRALSPTGGLRTFAEVAAELRASKAARHKAGGLDVQTERSFRKRSERLEKTLIGPMLVSQIGPGDIEKVLGSLSETQSTRSAKPKTLSQRSVLNYRNIFAEIFRHAKAKQYSPTNPMDGLTKEDLKKLGGVKAERGIDGINILKVQEAGRLLNAAAEHGEVGMLATLVLRLFCGFRTGEVSQLDWSEVHWLDAKPTVILPAGKAKKRRNREVEIPANALEWLKLCNPPAQGRIDTLSPKTYAKRVGRIAQLAGIGKKDAKGNWVSAWEINDTRHSFGSYHYALHGNSTYTAAQMGHKSNDDQLFTSYRALVRKQEAEAFFALVPPNPVGKVTAFPQAAAAS